VDWNDPEAIAKILDGKKEGDADQGQPKEGEGQPEADPAKPKDAQKKEGDQGQPEASDAPPESWNAQAKEAWAKLPPEIKAEVQRVEAVRDQVVAGEVQERQRAVEISQAIYDYAQTELNQAILASRAALEGEFGTIDWNALRQTNPEMALQLEGLQSRRLAGLQAIMEQQRQLTEAGEAYQRQQYGRYLMEQGKDAVARIKAVVGEEVTPAAWKAEAVKYLTAKGVPPEHIAGLAHGYQVEILAKAMKYDQMMGAAQTADNKLAAAPKVMPPKAGPAGPGADEGKSGLQKARALIDRNPNSNDNIAAALGLL
jgi:hypothetical protein